MSVGRPKGACGLSVTSFQRQPAQDAWKADVLAGRIVLEDLDTGAYDLYSHQNEDIVRLTPEQLKQRMADKERMLAAGALLLGKDAGEEVLAPGPPLRCWAAAIAIGCLR